MLVILRGKKKTRHSKGVTYSLPLANSRSEELQTLNKSIGVDWTFRKLNKSECVPWVINCKKVTVKEQATNHYNFHVLTTNHITTNWPIQTTTRGINTIIRQSLFTWLWRYCSGNQNISHLPITVFLITILMHPVITQDKLNNWYSWINTMTIFFWLTSWTQSGSNQIYADSCFSTRQDVKHVKGKLYVESAKE